MERRAVPPWPISDIPDDAGPLLYRCIRRQEGMAAKRAGRSSLANPYSLGGLRQVDAWSWVDGYLRAGPRRSEEHIARLFELIEQQRREPNPWGAAWGDTPFG